MSVQQVIELEKLLQNKYQVKKQSVLALIAPGENYGSDIVSVDVTLEDDNILKLVAKLVPTNKMAQKIFNTSVTFKNEIGFYKYIVPVLRDFQRQHNIEEVIDYMPDYYGSRLNLNYDSGAVDAHGALLLENLKTRGFETVDRFKSLSLVAAKVVLENLAKFHAVPLALKLQQPEIFEKNVKPFLALWKLPEDHKPLLTKNIEKMFEQFDDLKEYSDLVLQRFNADFDKNDIREPFATIAHNDCWVNNNMFKFVNGEPVKNVILDYQTCCYGSPARDILFFIFACVDAKIIDEHLDDLIKFYYEKFAATLLALHCEVEELSFENFLKELKLEAKDSQLSHLTFMAIHINASKENAAEMKEFNEDKFNCVFNDNHHRMYACIFRHFKEKKWF